ncbi:unnamed protein product [Rotaria sordida]|uniref:Uncharacterized protein n=1 Tax=Rotaria sordida TaxID=392033 RepID=A0A813VWL4_9BILA|nr:unnamed protein product [Rotaria sordida]
MINNAAVAPTASIPPTVPPNNPTQQEWRQKYPAVLSGILSCFQFILTLAIIGCEIGSILIDIVTATIYVGLWAGLFFIVASISQSSSSCCCRDRGCATYTLATQCISLFFAACVIGFDAYFLIQPSTCFFPSSTCNSSGSTRGLFYSTSNFNDIKIPLIKAQLGAACGMFVLCLVFIIIYIVTAIRIKRARTKPTVYPEAQNTLPAVPTGPDGMITAPPVMNIRAHKPGSPLYHRPTIVVDNGDGRANDLVCPTCTTTMAVTVRKKLP